MSEQVGYTIASKNKVRERGKYFTEIHALWRAIMVSCAAESMMLLNCRLPTKQNDIANINRLFLANCYTLL